MFTSIGNKENNPLTNYKEYKGEGKESRYAKIVKITTLTHKGPILGIKTQSTRLFLSL